MIRGIVLTFTILMLSAGLLVNCGEKGAPERVSIPLPEHPRPDFMRPRWKNLNGEWDFALDSLRVGESEKWYGGDMRFPLKITVPFSWASPLSGIGRKDIHHGWYARDIEVPADWEGDRVFLVIGASDCVTTVWLNGDRVGEHEGGYTPFEFDLTDFLAPEGPNRLVVEVEDEPKKGRLVGKQVYGEAKGIWQTVYLEARPEMHITRAHFTPEVDEKRVAADIGLSRPAGKDVFVVLKFADPGVGTVRLVVPEGKDGIGMPIPIGDPHLWDLDDPYLYEVDLVLEQGKKEIDRVHTYFGMRKIGTAKLPGSDDRYITLNDRPLYLCMALDQSYHPEGYYTFPSDAFMREEIERAKRIGLNGLRIHIKAEIPRKLYWADKLGLLVMQDVPNIGGEPDEYGRRNWEYTARGMFDRDYNHPSIFSWVLFNETWGLTTRVEKSPGEFVGEYTPETQEWVKSLYEWAKKTDPSRLVEDNSPDQGRRWHVVTDINSWHAYLPGYRWASYMDMVVENTYPGSPWNYIPPYRQGDVPMMNSECGNVWGYKGGTGDVDISYEYHIMMNEYRRRPKICGFIFTEFHDVINEWNGYYRYDRSPKDFGLDELCPGMTVRDFHSPLFLIPGKDFKKVVRPGEAFAVPITASFLTGDVPGECWVVTTLHGWNGLGEHEEYFSDQHLIRPRPYSTYELAPVKFRAPEEECLAVLCTYLITKDAKTLHHNFVPVRVTDGVSPRTETVGGALVLRKPPAGYSKAEWSVKTKSVLGGLKVWGTGTGFFEYEFPWPENVSPESVGSVEFRAELSSRRIQGKDMDEHFERMGISNVSRRGTDPGHNPNSYPMTDGTKHPATVVVYLNGTEQQTVRLEDDPADHRGILSWLAQREDGTLEEAGSYGYLVKVPFDSLAVRRAAGSGVLRVRLAVESSSENSGGLCVYGGKFGRYPLDPSIVIRKRKK